MPPIFAKDEYKVSRELEEKLQKLHDIEQKEKEKLQRYHLIEALQEEVEKKKQSIQKMREKTSPGLFGTIKKSRYIQNFQNNSKKLAEKFKGINENLKGGSKNLDEWKARQEKLNKLMLGGK
jgi:soluble cytochrome b562